MKLSIVTICLNDEEKIISTIESVFNQEYQDIEYIIKNGMSVDHTWEVINRYRANFESKGIPYICVNQEDRGIYDAMNQALTYCHGEWVIFLNAGDVFFDRKVCMDFILHVNRLREADVIYGYTLINLDDKYKFIQIHMHENIKRRFDLGHQSTFVKTDVMKKERFDARYKIAGDWELFLRLYNSGYCFQRINMVVSEFKRDGISSQKTTTNFYEDYHIRYGRLKAGYWFKACLNDLKRILSRIFPQYEKYRYCRNYMKRCRGEF